MAMPYKIVQAYPRLRPRGLKRPKVKSLYVKRVKATKASIMRMWGIMKPRKLRYENPIEKGIYWYHLSLFVRRRDVEQYGTCISCGKPITVETSQAGHFMPAKTCGRDLLFDLRNLNAECGPCNGFDETHLLGYARNLDKRYGLGTADALYARYEDKQTRRRTEHLIEKEWKKEVYVEMLRELGIVPVVSDNPGIIQ